MKTNTAPAYSPPPRTHEGAVADRITPLQQLRRSVLTCLLWEDNFYESGAAVAARIADLCTKVKPEDIATLAIEAREAMKLRHVPLYLAVQLSKRKGYGSLVTDVLDKIVQRADEPAELLAMYWQDRAAKFKDIDGRRQGGAISHRGIKTGLANALHRFNEYQLAKWRGDDKAVKLRDVIRLVHPKASSPAQADLWKRVMKGELATPDTWEVELSAGKDKRETFTRLLTDNKLGGLALLRNLRNMEQAGVDRSLVSTRLEQGVERALPFRFITAARYAPNYEPSLEIAMFKAIEGMPKLPGKTGLMVDVSGSMDGRISAKSETTRIDVAAGLSILVRELCETAVLATFSDRVVAIPPRRGFALRDAVLNSQPHHGTYLAQALATMTIQPAWKDMDRLIVLTDEQSADGISLGSVTGLAYCVNVASNANGVSYKNGWQHIDGWSEAVLDYIREIEIESANETRSQS
jgi:60 kDa SS-A/Ro ribonucleoprotein